MKSIILAGLVTIAVPALAQDHQPIVNCGFIKRTASKDKVEEGAFKVVLTDALSGELAEHKVVFDDAQGRTIKSILLPTRSDTAEQLALPRIARTLLSMVKESNQAVCISTTFSTEAIKTGFPYEFGVGANILEAAEDLAKRSKY